MRQLQLLELVQLAQVARSTGNQQIQLVLKTKLKICLFVFDRKGRCSHHVVGIIIKIGIIGSFKGIALTTHVIQCIIAACSAAHTTNSGAVGGGHGAVT